MKYLGFQEQEAKDKSSFATPVNNHHHKYPNGGKSSAQQKIINFKPNYTLSQSKLIKKSPKGFKSSGPFPQKSLENRETQHNNNIESSQNQTESVQKKKMNKKSNIKQLTLMQTGLAHGRKRRKNTLNVINYLQIQNHRDRFPSNDQESKSKQDPSPTNNQDQPNKAQSLTKLSEPSNSIDSSKSNSSSSDSEKNQQPRTKPQSKKKADKDEKRGNNQQSKQSSWYVVDDIVGHKITGTGPVRKLDLQVSWEGFKTPTWEPYKQFCHDASSLVQRYLVREFKSQDLK